MLPKKSSTVSNRTEKPGVILLFGPTAVGKTSLIEKLFSSGAEIVSADALQVYRQLNIGTAKPDADILSRIPHHLIDIVDFRDNFSVGDFCLKADEAVARIIERKHLPVISGGTAFYLKSWLMGMPDTPVSDPKIRADLERQWADKSDAELKEELFRVDPVSAEKIGRKDRYRMLRALEVQIQTGRPLSSFPVPSRPRADYRVLSIGLRRNRKELYERINLRVEKMFEEGLAEEIASLIQNGAKKNHPGMKAIGYREWFGTEEEPEPGIERIKELIARNTRRYAKRQITFFASIPDVHWFEPSDKFPVPEGIESLIDNFKGNIVS